MLDEEHTPSATTDAPVDPSNPYAAGAAPAAGAAVNGGGGQLDGSAPPSGGGAPGAGLRPPVNLAVHAEEPSSGLGAWKWLIWIGALILINVLSYAFDWPFWIY